MSLDLRGNNADVRQVATVPGSKMSSILVRPLSYREPMNTPRDVQQPVLHVPQAVARDLRCWRIPCARIMACFELCSPSRSANVDLADGIGRLARRRRRSSVLQVLVWPGKMDCPVRFMLRGTLSRQCKITKRLSTCVL